LNRCRQTPGSVVAAAILFVLDVIPDRVARNTACGSTYRRPSARGAYRRTNQSAGSGTDSCAANGTRLTRGQRFSGASGKSK
jgi:hypothetical protein